MAKSSPRLSSVTLRVPNTKIDGLKKFYTKVLGMNHVLSWDPEESIDSFEIPQHHPKYPECLQKHNSINLKFVSKPYLGPYRASKEDLYWKIGLALNDVNAAVDTINKVLESSEEIKNTNNPVQHGNQFFDIGYLTHLSDPCGFSIELLQTTFEQNNDLRTQLIKDVIKEEDEVIDTLKTQQSSKSNKKQPESNPSLLSSQPFIIGQITTRITNPENSLKFYTNTLKMKLLSIQEVKQYKFTLYFFGYTSEDPPQKDDLRHVDNREWLWQRKYTTLELQWRWDSKSLNHGKEDSTCLDCIEVEIDKNDESNPSSLLQALKKEPKFCPMKIEQSNVSLDGCSTLVHGMISDPDGLKIKIITKVADDDAYEA